jgi:hypothetical protein
MRLQNYYPDSVVAFCRLVYAAAGLYAKCIIICSACGENHRNSVYEGIPVRVYLPLQPGVG